ncbi:MAG: hypothetical protein K8E24_013015 [Methanobacterium paludis]|nr:hypothetical protein [Methanobacterium paludis]
MLLKDSTGEHQKPRATNEKEAELLKKMADMDDVLNKEGLGVIGIETPSSYFNLLCYLISYKTGTSLIDVKTLSLFDFICFLYIIRKNGEEEGGGMADRPTPEGKDEVKMLGG